mgnify:CR=1 FL=1
MSNTMAKSRADFKRLLFLEMEKDREEGLEEEPAIQLRSARDRPDDIEE